MLSKKTIFITSLGNILEWFDFGIFIYLAPLIGEKFFPTTDARAATLASFAVFAAGYICRPLGGVIFGHFGDTKGRAKTLRYSILAMSFSTFLVALLPAYQTIGIIAPIMLTSLRIMQGISVGGEYSGIMIYLAESSSIHSRGFMTSFAGSSANFGFLLAIIMILILKMMPHTMLHSWGFRVPFFFMGMLGTLLFYFRFKLTETNSFENLKKIRPIEQKPFMDALSHAPKSLLKILGLTCSSASFYIIFFGFMPQYLSKNVILSAHSSYLIEIFSLMIILLLIPLAGWIGDRVGRRKMLMGIYFIMMISVIPLFHLLQIPFFITTVLFIAAFLSAFDQGNNLAAFVENCPTEIRYSGIAFSYNLGNAIFGGTMPLIATYLMSVVGIYAPGYMLFFTATISLLTAFTLLNKSDASNKVM